MTKNMPSPTPLAAWVQSRRQARGWSQRQLAEAIGADQSIVSRIESGRFIVPEKQRLAAIERELGRLPAPIIAFVSRRKDARAAPMRKRFEYRVSKWSRSRLIREFEKMGERPSDHLEGVPYAGPVGRRGYDALMRARAAQMRQHWNGPGTVDLHPPQPRGRLRHTLRALEGTLGTRFGQPTQPTVVFQCQGCGDVIGRPASFQRREILCGLCYRGYFRGGYSRWLRGDRAEPAPALPRTKGRLASPGKLRRQIINLLQDVLGDVRADDTKATWRTLNLLMRSRDRWALSIVEAYRALRPKPS